MTRIALLSDLHNEFEPPRRSSRAWIKLDAARRARPGHPDVGPLLDAARAKGKAVDLVLMPGDIDVGARGIAYADAVAKYLDAPVACVMGNHESYNRDLEATLAALREAAALTAGRVAFLENDAVRIAGVRVLGCTLWTDYACGGDREGGMAQAGRVLNDHRLIVLRGRRFTPEDAAERHAASLAWLRTETFGMKGRSDERDTPPTVIMTHHAPVPEANPPRFVDGPLAAAFVSDLKADIAALRPALWVSGHTHHSIDMTLGCTRVVSAQRGYVSEDAGAEAFTPTVLTL